MLPAFLFAHGLSGNLVQKNRKNTSPPLAEGTKLGAFGLTEPNAGSDAARQQSTAVRKGDYYILNGSKNLYHNGGEADIYVVFAMTDKRQRHERYFCFYP